MEKSTCTCVKYKFYICLSSEEKYVFHPSPWGVGKGALSKATLVLVSCQEVVQTYTCTCIYGWEDMGIKHTINSNTSLHMRKFNREGISQGEKHRRGLGTVNYHLYVASMVVMILLL